MKYRQNSAQILCEKDFIIEEEDENQLHITHYILRTKHITHSLSGTHHQT